jgi:hypothetical protein
LGLPIVRGEKISSFMKRKLKNVCERPGKKSSKFPQLKNFQHSTAQRVRILNPLDKETKNQFSIILLRKKIRRVTSSQLNKGQVPQELVRLEHVTPSKIIMFVLV